MKIEKKHIIVGLVGIVTTIGAIALWQYYKLMDYVVSVKKFQIKSITSSAVSFNLYLNFTNKSLLKYEILFQEYKLYVNDNFILQAGNSAMNVINATSTSEISVNVAFNPTDVGKILKTNWIVMATNPNDIRIRIDMKLKVRIKGFTFSIPASIPFTFKELTEKK